MTAKRVLKIRRIIDVLEEEYGRPVRRTKESLLEQLILTILSQNTSDVNRDRAFARLRGKFPDLMSIAASSPSVVEDAIRVGGLAGIKSTRIYSIVMSLECSKTGHDLGLRGMGKEAVRERLMAFKGVGRKTADCVLLFGMEEDAFPVDTHVHRLSKRLDLVPPDTSRDCAAEILEGDVPSEDRYSLHVNLIRHGRRVCRPRNPRCGECSLRRLCTYYKKKKNENTPRRTRRVSRKYG